MSKSYGNTIPLFAPPKQMKKVDQSIVTDSTPPEAPKDPDASTIFQIYKAIATPDETRALAERYRAGIGWGDAKEALFEVLNRALEEPRRRYADLMANPARVDALLLEGAQRARALASPTLDEVRRTIGAR